MEPFTPAQLGEARNVMDSVMGGVSQGGWIPNASTFFGETSLRNNGGFASIRWRFPNAQNWSYAKGIYIRSVRVCSPWSSECRIDVAAFDSQIIQGPEAYRSPNTHL